MLEQNIAFTSVVWFRELASGLLVDHKLTSGIRALVRRCGSELNLVEGLLVACSATTRVIAFGLLDVEEQKNIIRFLIFALKIKVQNNKILKVSIVTKIKGCCFVRFSNRQEKSHTSNNIVLWFHLLSIIQTLCGYLALWTGSFDFRGRDCHAKFKGNQRKAKAKGDDGEGLYVREELIVGIHNNRKKSTGYVKKDDQPSSSGSTYDNFEVMMVMSAQGLFGKKSLGKLDFGENCALGKSHRVSFSVGRPTTQGVIDYAHSDYGVRLRWNHWEVRAFGKFKEWKQLVENQTGRTVKKLRTNNGLEFCNWEFKQQCVESGIARHLTVSGLPKTFWAEATCTAAYLINRSPLTAIEKKTPTEMWSGHPSDYMILRIFNCVAYPHDKHGKIEPRAIKCVLLRYPKGVKEYRLYKLDNESPKIVTIRNVVFNESVMYKDTFKDFGASDKSVEELQVEVELQRLNNYTSEEDQTDQEDGVDEDTRDQETDQPSDLTNYQLVRDREPRTRTKPLRYVVPTGRVIVPTGRDIWNAVKARFGGNVESKKMRKSMLKQEFSEFRIGEVEGLHKGYDRMQKILSQLNQLKAKPKDEDINLKFLRALPSSWSHVALTLKTKEQQRAYEDFKQIKKLDLEEIDLKWQMAMLSVRVHKFEQKARRKIDFDKKESARFNKKKVRCYKCQQRGHFAREFRAKEGNDKQRYFSFKIKEIGKKEKDSKALINVDTLVDWTDHDSESDGVIAAKEFSMIAGCDSEDAIEEGVVKIYNLIIGADTKEASTADDAKEFALMGVTSKVHNCPFGCEYKYNELHKQYNELNEQNGEYFIQVQAYKNSLKTLEKQKRVLQRNQLTLEDKIRVLSIELENTSNLLKHSERINADVEIAKKELQTKLDNHLLGWDDSAFSVFTTNSEDVKGRPLSNRFAKTDSMKAIHPPLSGDYTSLSDHIDLDESQMSYGTKSSTSCDSKSVSNDFISYDDSDKSSEVNTNDFASSDSSVKFLEPKPNDTTSCASTPSVSTFENEAEIESNVGTPIQEPIIVQDLPSFSCNSSDRNENTFRTSCNKNGYFNKKASHFRKHASSVSKLCFVCGSGTHLIKDCNFYKKQMANKTVGIGVGYVHCRDKVNQQNQFVLQFVLLRTGKVNIPPARPQPVPIGKSKVFAPVPAGRQNRPFPVPTVQGYSPSVSSGWWKNTDRSMPHFSRPTSSYFQTYTPYVPTMSYNHMKYGGNRWATTVKPLAGCSWKSHRKAAEDEGIFDSGCSRSMTGNKERLDDFQAFQGGKVTFGGGEGRIIRKGTIRTPTLDFENVYYVKELQQFNLFPISQICNKKNRVLFTNTECLVLSKDFKLPDDSMVVLKVLRKHNLYTINLTNLCPRGNLACLVAHASFDEYVKWHRRMGHVNYKNMNRLVKDNLVRGLPPKLFKHDHTCVACCKGKQHKASYKAIHAVRSIFEPLQLLHMDLFGPTSIRSIDHKYYCLVITDDYSRTPQQNRVAERKNRTLTEAAKTMLVDSKLPTIFWTEAVRIACYVVNRVSVTSPHNKTPYALLTGNIPSADEGYIVGYSASNKAYRVYNVPNKRVEESMNVRFLEEKPNVQGLDHEWIHRSEPKDTSNDEVDNSPFHSADELFQKELAKLKGQEQRVTSDAENLIPTGSIPVPIGSIPVPAGDTMVFIDDVSVHTSSSTDSFFDDEPLTRFPCPSDLGKHDPTTGIFSSSSYDDEFGAALNNVASTVEVSPVETKRINTIHPQSLIIGDPTLAVQTRSKVKQTTTGKYAIGTKWILKNKRDARGIVVQNKARLVAQRHRQEEGIDYDEVFAPVSKIEAIRLFLAFASYMGFLVYQMDVKSAFLYGRIDEEAWCDEFEALMKGEFQMSDMGELTFFQASRPDIMFAVSAYSRNQVTLTTSNLEAMKKIFKYLKGQPKLGLWYPKESPLVLEAYSDSDYAGANKDRKSTTGGCQFLGRRLISWQCKKQTIVATSSTEAEYVTAANCCGQVLWIQNQLLDYGLMVQDGGLVLFKYSTWTRYALPHNPIIFDSLVKQFWSTATLSIDDLPIADVYSGMDNLGFLQTILGIETKITRQYKVLVFSSKLFANMRLNFEGHHMPLLPAMLLQAQAGEVLEHCQSSDPNTASFSRSYETDVGPFTNVEDAPVGGTFHISPSSTQAPSAGQPSGGAKDPITLTALSSVVSTLVQKVHSLETELNDHKNLFKDVVGKLVKKVKTTEVKLKAKKRKMVVSDSDQKDDEKQDVDLDALRALANAAVTVDSNIPSGGTSQIPAASPSVPTAGPPGTSTVPPGASTIPPSALTVLAGSPSVPADVSPSVAPAGVLDKGKYPMVEEDIPVKARTFKQMQEDILGEQAGKRLHGEKQANLDRQRAELQRRRQKEVLDSAMYYNEADWLNIMAQVEANAYISKTLLEEFEKIRKFQSNSQIQAFSRTMKRSGPVLEEPSSQRQKSTEALIPSMPEVVVNEDSDDEASPVWSALVGWEVIPTSLGSINALYRLDGSTKQFTTLRQILHMMDRQDLVLFDSHTGGKGFCIWQNQNLWEIKSWRLYTLSNVHVLETVSGEVLYIFTHLSYPLSVKLIERMLTHKLEIDTDVVGNDMTTDEQLIQFIKNQLAAAQASSV
nr:ribonuclease H-like domain-containing protein [Tanacetum cinerariifolium]